MAALSEAGHTDFDPIQEADPTLLRFLRDVGIVLGTKEGLDGRIVEVE